MGLMFLTAYKIGASAKGVRLTTPKVIQINSENILKTQAIPSTADANGSYIPGTSKIEVKTSGGGSQVFGVYETIAQIEAASDPSTSNVYATGQVALSLDAHGNSAATGRALERYLHEIDTATTTSSDGVTLKSAVANAVQVVINNTAVALEGWPNNASDTIEGDSGAYAIPAWSRKHFVAQDDVNWVVSEE